MALFTIVMASIAQMIRHTVRFYNTNVQATEVQQQTIQAIRWIKQEMEEGSYKSLQGLTDPTTAVVFGSPRDLDGKIQFDGDNMLWQKFVCYYVSEIQGQLVLLRGELLFDDAAKAAPPVPASLTISSFTEPGAKQRVMARHIESLTVGVTDSAELEIKANLDDGAFTLKLKTRVEMGN